MVVAKNRKFLRPAAAVVEPKAKSDVLCSTCVNFIEDNLSTLIDIILDGGVIGSCEVLCTKLSNKYEDGICTLLCIGVGIDAFIQYLDRHDNDPVYLCTDLKACPRNHCNSTTDCITITEAAVNPATGPVRTTFQLEASLKVWTQTGTGVTIVIVTPPGNPNTTNPFGFAVLNEGYAPGDYKVTVKIPTDEFDWQFAAGVYQVEVDQCGSDCDDKYGVVFSIADTNFTLTKP